jgi:predicted enzyme related to lactoylglutathione lyase
MLKLSSIMIGSSDPQKLAEFYEKVLEKKPDMAEGGWYGFSVGECFLSIGAHDKVTGMSVNPERVIFNFETKEVVKEFDRIKALGATGIAEPYKMEGWEEPGIATLADPEGNYFQLMHPWE